MFHCQSTWFSNLLYGSRIFVFCIFTRGVVVNVLEVAEIIISRFTKKLESRYAGRLDDI